MDANNSSPETIIFSSSSSSSEERASVLMQSLTNLRSLVQQKIANDSGESSRPTRKSRTAINRDRSGAHDRLFAAYFADNPMYDGITFRRRFRMSKTLFLRIVQDLENFSTYFQQNYDARGRRGFSALQKCTSAIRQLAYGSIPDSNDEYLQMSERTSRESLDKFCKYVIRIYGKEYLRKPTTSDVQLLYGAHESVHGFPGMLGSIDCTHWEWGNCPTAWRGQYMRGDHSSPTIMLEAVASQDLWIWHAFFGVAGSNNDINVLNQSPLLNDIKDGKAPTTTFVVNNETYKYGYYLADGIYPEHAVFVKAFTIPNDEKRKRFKQAQEAARKDVERAFGVLKKR